MQHQVRYASTAAFQAAVDQLCHGEYVVLGTYVRQKTPVLFCHRPYHHQFWMTPTVFFQKLNKHTTPCSICGSKRRIANIRKHYHISDQQFRQQVQQLDSSYVPLSHYVNAHTKMTFYHQTCGHQFQMTANAFKNGNRCPYCHRQHLHDKRGHYHTRTVTPAYIKKITNMEESKHEQNNN